MPSFFAFSAGRLGVCVGEAGGPEADHPREDEGVEESEAEDVWV
jgi:hypothetical protein